MIFVLFLNVDSLYNYLVKNLKLNPKTTYYKVDTIGLNFYNVLIKSYDKKINLSKIIQKFDELGLSKKDSLFFGKILSNEISELKVNYIKDSLFLEFKVRVPFKSLTFNEKELENYLINLIENSTNIKIDRKQIKNKLETKSDFYEYRISFKGEKNSKFSQDDITKIKNSLLRNNVYAMDYQLGKLIYVRFSGLILDYVVYDSYIKYFEDSLLSEIRIKKPELKTTIITSEILKILKLASKDKIVGYGIREIYQDLKENKIVNGINLDVIMRKDVDFEDLRNNIVNEGTKISDNNNAYVVSGIIVISNPKIRDLIYKTIRIEFQNFSDYDIYKVGKVNVEVQ